jgi:ATP-dependent protease HslVU (ClpYQ) peptidase subunit
LESPLQKEIKKDRKGEKSQIELLTIAENNSFTLVDSGDTITPSMSATSVGESMPAISESPAANSYSWAPMNVVN